MDRSCIHTGKKLYLEGFNCAQAVFASFSKTLGYKLEDALAIASAFGGGIARTKETCGALIGALMAIGYSRRDLNKEELYHLSQDYMRDFHSILGSTKCESRLNDVDNKSGFFRDNFNSEFEKRPCVKVVEIAIELALKYLI